MQKYPYLFLVLLVLFLAPACQKTADEPIIDSSQNSNVDSTVDTEVVVPKEDIMADYINTNRVIWQKPNVVIDFMGDISDKVVADIGAGTGYFAFRIAQKAKKVIAIDINESFIEYLDSAKVMELPEADQSKLEARFAEPDDPNLAPGEVDFIIMVNTYMWIEEQDRIAYLKKLWTALPEQGQILILDFKKKRTPLGPAQENRIPLYVVEENLLEAGFTNVRSNDKALDYQYIIMAEK